MFIKLFTKVRIITHEQNETFSKEKIYESRNRSQDGSVGGCGVCISLQLGHLPDAGGGP